MMTDKNTILHVQFDLCPHVEDQNKIGGRRRCDECQKEVDEQFDEFWRPLIYPNGELDVEEMKGDLNDFSNLMDNAKSVYMHVTNGNIGNLLTDAEAVIGEADRQIRKEVAAAVTEAVESERD